MAKKSAMVKWRSQYQSLIIEIDDAKKFLEQLPDDQEWSQEQLEYLEDARHSALGLAREIEATIETFEGRTGT